MATSPALDPEPANPNPNPNLAIIDPAFVVPPEHRPVPHLPTHSHRIPVIDLSPLFHPHLRLSVVEQVGRACQEWGFFQVINHGIPPSSILPLKDAARSFFLLPLHEKLKVKRSAENAMGYNNGELTKNTRDWKEVFDIAAGGVYRVPGDDGQVHDFSNRWPSGLPGFRNACEDYVAEAEKLSFTLLELISESLGLPPSLFHEHFISSGTSLFRMNHYPVCPAPHLALGVSRHKDIGALTVLLQDEVGGLEVRRSDGEWIPVEPNPAALVINVGDMIQVYSNDKYQSVEHRVVVNDNSDRYSFPLFFNPAHWVDVAPIQDLLDTDNPPRYRPFNWGKYIKSRNDSNFKNLGVENTQLYHYATAHALSN